MGAADASRRFAYCSFMVGTLPRRRLAVMSLYWQHLATPDVVDELFLIGLRTLGILTSADVVSISKIKLFGSFFCDYLLKKIACCMLTYAKCHPERSRRIPWKGTI